MLAAYMVTMTLANVGLVYAARTTGASAWTWFIAANLSGFLATVLMTLALKETRPVLAAAIGIGGGFCLLQAANYWLFEQGMTPAQWIGAACVCVGVVLLQVRM